MAKYNGPERRLFTRRDIDARNAKLLDLLKKEVEIYEKEPKPTVWVCKKNETGRILAVGQTQHDVINFMKSMCQFFSVRTEMKSVITGHYKTKTNPEEFEFTITKFKLLQNIPETN